MTTRAIHLETLDGKLACKVKREPDSLTTRASRGNVPVLYMEREAMSVKPSKVLRAAADLLGQGWCQRYLGIRDKASCWQAARQYGLPIIYRESHEFQPGVVIDSVCLQGALMKAAVDLSGVGWPAKEGTVTPEQEAMRASYRAAGRAVAEAIARRGAVTGTARWNDVAGRTQAEVVALVLGVAAHEEAVGR